MSLPPIPVFELIMGIVIIVGGIEYLVVERGRIRPRERREPTTGHRAAICMTVSRAPSGASCCSTLVGPFGAYPELAGATSSLVALSGGITNRNFLVTASDAGDR